MDNKKNPNAFTTMERYKKVCKQIKEKKRMNIKIGILENILIQRQRSLCWVHKIRHQWEGSLSGISNGLDSGSVRRLNALVFTVTQSLN